MEQPIANYNINVQKAEKYITRLANGEAYNLDRWIANLLTINSGISGTMEREKYDYRIGEFKKKKRSGHDSHYLPIMQKIEQLRQLESSYRNERKEKIMAVVKALSNFKIAVDNYYELEK
jgi:hypothetical protein